MRAGRRLVPCVAVLAMCLAVSGEPEGAFRASTTGLRARALGARRGRPRKFNRPTQAVTLTLPIETIATLRNIDADISRAVVRVIEPLTADGPPPNAELATYGNRALIIVTPNAALRERTGAEFVPLPNGRALVAFGETMSASTFELRLRDALNDEALSPADRATFLTIVEILRDSRQRTGGEIPERSIMVLEA